MRRAPVLDALKAEVWAELRRGENIVETELHSHERNKYYGLCVNDRNIYVNPYPSIVETVVHETLHRQHPRWSEARVNTTAIRILNRMSNREVQRWVKQYKSVARKRRTPLDVELAS